MSLLQTLMKSSQAILTHQVSYVPSIIFNMLAYASNQRIKLNQVALLQCKPSKTFE